MAAKRKPRAPVARRLTIDVLAGEIMHMRELLEDHAVQDATNFAELKDGLRRIADRFDGKNGIVAQVAVLQEVARGSGHEAGRKSARPQAAIFAGIGIVIAEAARHLLAALAGG